MIQEIAPKKFDNAYHAKSPKPDDFVLVFRGHGKPDDRILCRIEDGKIILPTYSELGCEKHLLQYLFSIDETCYFLYMPGDLSAGLFISDIFSFSYEPIRSLRRNDPVYTCFAGMTGYHLYVWYRDNVFCGRCGVKTVHDKKGHAVQGYGLKQVRQSPDNADEAFDQSGGLGENDPHAADYGDAGARHSQEAAQGQGRKQDDPDKVLVVLYPLRALLDDAGSAFHQVVDYRKQRASRRFRDVVELLLEPFKLLRLCLVHGGRHF